MPTSDKSSDKWYNANALEILLLSIPGFNIAMYFIMYAKLSKKERILLLPVVIVYTIIATIWVLHFFQAKK
ncbi:MAG TPA: hypothetical protein VN922_06135 [Bacteroidia bacterium]|nr:hypothetical protein [Bacteroidia bacterium]